MLTNFPMLCVDIDVPERNDRCLIGRAQLDDPSIPHQNDGIYALIYLLCGTLHPQASQNKACTNNAINHIH